ncbi:DNA-binding transcriptional regulator YbjK [Saccharopolyspora lacisalsi]|uniref:DNA-binding transcriptional regulator YbjK n=1 Tax=Halosaccharopolyspora lacisalsi TaxID=1000566 RepID=A0A839E0S0_9PSEU|nr:TetR family transcriptional regulator [Halosaccharopolyspora lacisalsi]MBA8827354.1 DNA-binding transcriptional regulator YbjK [Halosaccharopolyspora lacisalsi]
MTTVDGRRIKGERRRRAIVDATLRIVERDGVAGVSHRNIAREAGVPAASIAYYFGSIDELLVATLLESVETLIGELNRLADTVNGGDAHRPAAVARLLADMVREHRGRTIAEYELYLLAARRPALRPAARRWIEAASGYVDDGSGDPAVANALFAAIDGMLLHALIADEPPGPEDFEPTLSCLMRPIRHLHRIDVPQGE